MRPAATAHTPCRGHLELRICIHRRKASLALAYDLDAVPFSEVQMTRPVAGWFFFGFLARKNYISFHQDGETMQMSRIRHTECHSAKSKQRNFRVTGLSAAGGHVLEVRPALQPASPPTEQGRSRGKQDELRGHGSRLDETPPFPAVFLLPQADAEPPGAGPVPLTPGSGQRQVMQPSADATGKTQGGQRSSQNRCVIFNSRNP